MDNYQLSIKSIHNINKKVLFPFVKKHPVIYLFHFFVFGRKGGGVENEMMQCGHVQQTLSTPCILLKSKID